jgi:hypothetical protein
MRHFLPLLLVLSFACHAQAQDIPAYLQEISVTVRAGSASGSGTLKTTKDGQVWCWTAGHVIEDFRKVKKVIDSKGQSKTVVSFDDVKVQQVFIEDGRKVGEVTIDAEVIRYSDADEGEDLALLRLRSKLFKPKNSVKFWLEKKLPPLGTELWHCGSLLGPFGANSLVDGIISQHGRVYGGKIYDQTNVAAFGGSSGGIVCTKKDGLYVGMLVRGVDGGFNLIVPVRRMAEWSKEVGVYFAMDDAVAVPSEKDLKAHAVESGGSANGVHLSMAEKVERIKGQKFYLHYDAPTPKGIEFKVTVN